MPIDRQRMRPWLEEQIKSGKIQGLQWVNKEAKIFQIPWMHAARHGWHLDKDAPLFMNWAIHTGKYHPGVDKPDPKTWKANFRCALNSLPDIDEVKDKSYKRGNNAFRMYRILSPAEKAAKKVKKKLEGEQIVRKRRIKNADLEFGPALPDSTVLLNTEKNRSRMSRLMGSDPLDICAVVEITTENEESAVSSTQHCFPLQISPGSSMKADSGDEDAQSEEEFMEPEDLSNKSSRSSNSSVLRIPSSQQHRTHSFITSGKTNFWVTSCREETPLIAYDEPPWRPFLHSFPFQPVPSPDLPSSSSSSSSTASRSSVIMQAMDLSSTAGKTQ
ncbi:interferon regulatory factor 2a isoform X1 [Astyanax mexicanus]|uniref:interferon regulatory factor 2a isoform X1 n=1 Tax=Astyanax mexicanus TaxID=7994 RepID=UPI0020CAD019|nr:interferon regulatory factor 2a isoform X1 [Astyanax mexicanus]